MPTIDLKQFHAAFFAESFDGLDSMESSLLQMERGARDSELLNAIFRVIHSIKGASGTFGFNDIAQFTHTLETLLDEIRKGKREVNSHAINVLLESVDCLRQMHASVQSDTALDLAHIADVAKRIDALYHADDTRATEALEQIEAPGGERLFRISFHLLPRFFRAGNDLLNLFRLLDNLGELKIEVNLSHSVDRTDPESRSLAWQTTLKTVASRAEIEEIFNWVADDCEFDLIEEPADSVGMAPSGLQNSVTANVANAASVTRGKDRRDHLRRQGDIVRIDSSGISIHVSTEKVDRLINMVGELVITQSMINQIGADFDMGKLALLQTRLAQLERSTRELQESVMSIRMVPISHVFNRYLRMVRDMALQLDKEVELKISGEQCELDKILIEKIVDPLTHLIRNSMDHGLESRALRKQKGKPEQGTIWLHAEHSSGSVVITLRDDGQGLSHEKIRAKAIEQGLLEPQAALTPEQIEQLIFLPGFSTAATVSDISGRGVGLDVVRANIRSIGGSVEVNSVSGIGTRFTLRIPLTLAILDGLLVSVGGEVFVLPLTQVIESLRPERQNVKTITGEGQVLHIRDAYLPVAMLHELFSIPDAISQPWQGILVLVEVDGIKFAMQVDALLSQQQVVMKSMEANYRKVDGMLGATILGDGKVALILDVTAVLRLHQKKSQKRKQSILT